MFHLNNSTLLYCPFGDMRVVASRGSEISIVMLLAERAIVPPGEGTLLFRRGAVGSLLVGCCWISSTLTSPPEVFVPSTVTRSPTSSSLTPSDSATSSFI